MRLRMSKIIKKKRIPKIINVHTYITHIFTRKIKLIIKHRVRVLFKAKQSLTQNLIEVIFIQLASHTTGDADLQPLSVLIKNHVDHGLSFLYKICLTLCLPWILSNPTFKSLGSLCLFCFIVLFSHYWI